MISAVARINAKSSSSTIIEYFGMFYVNSENRESWITVHHRAEEETSIICVANYHSLPWKITSNAPKIRTTLKRR